MIKPMASIILVVLASHTIWGLITDWTHPSSASAFIGQNFTEHFTEDGSQVATPDPGEPTIEELQRELLQVMVALNASLDGRNPGIIETTVAEVRTVVETINSFEAPRNDLLVTHVYQGADLAEECLDEALVYSEELRNTGTVSFDAGFGWGFCSASYNTWSGIDA